MASARSHPASLASGVGAVVDQTAAGRANAGVRGAKCNYCQKAYSGEVVAKNLKCGHAVCSLCLAIYFQDGQIKCPLCQEVTNAKNLDEFSTNFELQNLIDQLNKVQISAASQSAPAAAASVATTTIKSGRLPITVKVVDQDGRQIEFQMNSDSQLGRLMTRYAARKVVPLESLKFSFDGLRVQEEHTPAFFDMEDGDIIEVFSKVTPARVSVKVCAAKCNYCQKAYSGEVVAKNLKCGHAVCSLCLAIYFQDSQIKCPLCQEVTNAKNLDEFSTNFKLQSWTQAMQKGATHTSTPAALRYSKMSNRLSLRNIASCGICFELYDSGIYIPKQLTCGHSLCSICAIQIADDKDYVQCPDCRQQTSLKASGHLPTNYGLLAVLDQLTSENGEPVSDSARNKCTECQGKYKLDKLRHCATCFKDGDTKSQICAECWVENHNGHKHFSWEALEKERETLLAEFRNHGKAVEDIVSDFGERNRSISDMLSFIQQELYAHTYAVIDDAISQVEAKAMDDLVDRKLLNELGHRVTDARQLAERLRDNHMGLCELLTSALEELQVASTITKNNRDAYSATSNMHRNGLELAEASTVKENDERRREIKTDMSERKVSSFKAKDGKQRDDQSEEQRRLEGEERDRLRQAEEWQRMRREDEERERQKNAELRERDRGEAEKSQQIKREQEEKERQRAAAEVQEKQSREAKEREWQRAAAEVQERNRREAEVQEQLRREAEIRDQLRREAEEKERQRVAAGVQELKRQEEEESYRQYIDATARVTQTAETERASASLPANDFNLPQNARLTTKFGSMQQTKILELLQLHWGGQNLTNTCPWDCFFVSMASHLASFPENIKHITQANNEVAERVQTFMECVISGTLPADEAKEHIVWQLAKILNLSKGDNGLYSLYGNDYSPFVEHLEHIATIRCFAKCSNSESCPEPITHQDYKGFSIPQNAKNIKDAIIHQLSNRRRTVQCHQQFKEKPTDSHTCTSDADTENKSPKYYCTGTLTKYNDAQFIQPDPFVIFIRLNEMQAIEWHKLPEEIIILGIKFYLGSCNVSGVGRFTSIVKITSEWFYYDGLASPLFVSYDHNQRMILEKLEGKKLTHAFYYRADEEYNIRL